MRCRLGTSFVQIKFDDLQFFENCGWKFWECLSSQMDITGQGGGCKEATQDRKR